MADETRPMSDHEIALDLGALLATRTPTGAREGAGTEAEPAEAETATAVLDEEQADAESLGDQAEEDEAQAEGEEDEQAEDADDFKLAIKYKGQDLEITDRAEATRLAQLGRHFEERQNEIVQREKTAETVSTEADQLRTRYAGGLSEIAQFFEQVVGEPPKESDFKGDETAYLRAVHQHTQAQQAVTTYRAELQRVQAEQAEQQRKQMETWAKAQEDETLAAVPEWHDTAVRQAEVKEMGAYAEQIGVPAEALQSPLLVNAKWFRLMLRDAARYTKAAEAGSAEVKKAATKEAAPGSGAEVRQDGRNRQRRALEQRAASGKIDDIAPLMGQLLQRQKQLTKQPTR